MKLKEVYLIVWSDPWQSYDSMIIQGIATTYANADQLYIKAIKENNDINDKNHDIICIYKVNLNQYYDNIIREGEKIKSSDGN